MTLQLLVPLGLLGLLGILALIIIYIIKPNYLMKHVSSTFIWQLSLKYRKKKVPVSKIRNILIFLCQIVILTALAAILTMPVLEHKNQTDRKNVIAIIDSSASMYAQTEDETRFVRAVTEAKLLAQEVFAEGGYISVIIADDNPHFLRRDVTAANSAGLVNDLNALLEDDSACFYGTSDIEKAMILCEESLFENPSTQIYLYTDTTYEYRPEGIEVRNVSEGEEWNAGILNAHTEIINIFQELTVEVACYGRAAELILEVEVSGANAYDSSTSGQRINLSVPVSCEANTVKEVIFKDMGDDFIWEDKENIIYFPLEKDKRFQSFQSINISIQGVSDSFSADDSFNIYGGQKEVLKVQYASSRKLPSSSFDLENPGPNPFVLGALGMVKKAFANRWDIQISEVAQGETPALEGFDLYIFEHDMPAKIPTDGAVLLMDPSLGWKEAGVYVASIKIHPTPDTSFYLSEGAEQSNHCVLNDPNGYKIVTDKISVSKYSVLNCDPTYDVLMTCNTDPVLVVQKQESFQVAVMGFSLHYSNLPRLNEMPALFYNLFDYFFPATAGSYQGKLFQEKNSFEVGEEITLNARSPELTVRSPALTGSDQEESFKTFPATLSLPRPGTYTLKQTTYFGKPSTAELFVKTPALESNVHRVEEALPAPLRPEEKDSIFDDLLIYFAAVLVAFVFIERMLQAQEGR